MKVNFGGFVLIFALICAVGAVVDGFGLICSVGEGFVLIFAVGVVVSGSGFSGCWVCVYFFIFVWCLWRFPTVSVVVVGLVRQWSGFDGGFCACWSCFFSLSLDQLPLGITSMHHRNWVTIWLLRDD